MNRERALPRNRAARALGTPLRETPGRFRMPPKHPDCGKRRCETYEQALGYVLWLAGKSKDPLRIYACPRCDGFHVTKRPTWEDQ